MSVNVNVTYVSSHTSIILITVELEGVKGGKSP